MATNRHANQTDVNVHTPFRQVFANDAARLADATVYTASDVNKIALQSDSNALYRLSSIAPTTWTSVGGSGSGGGNAFVFRPGGVQTDNVYTDFNDLYDAAATIEGPKTIQFDDSLGSITIPAKTSGMYDFSNFSAIGLGGNLQTQVQFDTTTQCSAFFQRSTDIVYAGNGAISTPTVVMDTLGQTYDIIFENSNINTSGSAPFFSIDGTAGFPFASLFFTMTAGSYFTTSSPGSEIISVINGGNVYLNVFQTGRINPDNLACDISSAIVVQNDSSSYISQDQTNVIGSTTYTMIDVASMVANNRPWRDPLGSTDTIYVRSGGSDDNNGTSSTKAFATVERAFQETSWATDYLGAYARTIDVGPGTFAVPDIILGSGSYLLTGSKTILESGVVDASTPAATPTAGNILTLDATGMAVYSADELIGQLIHFPDLDVWARIYKNDATVLGAPNILVIWVVTESWTENDIPGIGDAVDFYSIDTIFEIEDSGCTFTGGSDYYASLFEFVSWQSSGTATGFDMIDTIGATLSFKHCDVLPTLIFNGAGGEHIMAGCYITSHIWQYEPNGALIFNGGNVIDGQGAAGSPMIWGPGAISAIYENAAVNISGTAPVFSMNGGRFYSDTQALSGAIAAEFSTMRLYQVPSAFHANYAADFTIGQGGEYRLPSFLPPYTTAGTQIAGTVTTVLVDVRSDSNANVVIGSNSSITIGSVLNPVYIGGTSKSADASGTRIIGGTPKPGASGPSNQSVVATADTWNGVSQTVALDSSSIGAAGTFNLPAGSTVTEGATVVIKNVDGTNSVAITPNGADTIDEVAAATNLTAAITLILQVLPGPLYNWMSATPPSSGDVSGVVESVLVATTENIVNILTGGPLVVDGVTLVSGNRVLVWQQTSTLENGIYEVTSAGTGSDGVWARSSDADTTGDIYSGMTVYTQRGDKYFQQKFTMTELGEPTIGVSAIVFYRVYTRELSPYGAGFAGYSVLPASTQDGQIDYTNVGPVLYDADSGQVGGSYWSRTPDGTHPIQGKIRRGMLDSTTDFCGVGWWTNGDGKVFLAFIPGVGYQMAYAPTVNDVATLIESPINVPEWPWEEANANGNVITFRVSVDGHRWVTLTSVDVSTAPYSTTTSSFSGFFVQGTATILIERSNIF